MTVAAVHRYASLLIWTAYLAVPVDAGGLIQGVPLGPIEATALLAIGWLAVYQRPVKGAAAAGAVLAVMLIASASLSSPGGFRARYFANAAATGPHERSTDHPDDGFTRLDGRLDFAPGGPEFPLAFFNDNSRFNFYRAGEPHRRRLEFAATWSGHWWIGGEGGTRSLYADAPQSSAAVFIDGASVMSVSPDTGAATADVSLAGGWHRLDVRFSSPYAAPRRFSAGELVAGDQRPFDATSVLTRRIPDWHMPIRGVVRTVKTALDIALLAWLAWQLLLGIRDRVQALRAPAPVPAWREHVIALLLIVAAVEALAFAWPWSSQTLLLSGGDDPMTYEGYARDILFNGLLMNGGLPLGQGEPFYYQAFYPYFLAAVHATFGEGMFGVMLVQRLLVMFVIWALAEMAVSLYGERAWIAALGCATFFACWKIWPIAADLLSEALYVPLLVAWTAALVRTIRAPTIASAAGAGLLGGFTAVTRSTILLAWLIVFAVCWVAWKRAANRRALVSALVVCSLGIFSLIAVRNGIVAGRFVPTPTGFGVTLLGGNEAPPGVVIDLSARARLYDRLGLSATTAQVIEYAVSAPRQFSLNIARKALFALGFYEPYAPGWGYSPVYIAVWVTAGAGLVLAWRLRLAPAAAIILPILIAASQYGALVIVYPKGERLILPFYALLVPYSSMLVSRLGRSLGL